MPSKVLERGDWLEPREEATAIELDVRGLVVRVRAGFDDGTLARVLDVVEARR